MEPISVKLGVWARSFAGFFIIALLLYDGCTVVRVNRELIQVEEAKSINNNQLYIKVHLQNGHVYVLHHWTVSDESRTIAGLGNHLDVNRRVVESRGSDSHNQKWGSAPKVEKFTIPYADIVLIETNDKGMNPGATAMVFAGVATGIFAVVCAVNPKACFGSCPTFYIDQGDSLKLVAEGFSSSINQSLETTDVDMIRSPVDAGKRDFFMTVKNEALETHMLKKVHLLLARRDAGNQVMREVGGDFFQVTDFQMPVSATHHQASILKEISMEDGEEWHSLSDSADLSAKEEISLVFNNPGKETGLVITKRQSLMTTFLFYHSLSLLGNSAGYYYAQMATGGDWIRKRSLKLYDLLGGIEVWSAGDNGRWKRVTEINEQGPIAEDTHLVKLPRESGNQIKVKIRMSKGLWRINYLALASVLNRSETITLNPVKVWRDNVEDGKALARLLSERDYLVTYPRDGYRIQYSIPAGGPFEYFIESEGYYVEWMREEWLPTQDIHAAQAIFRSPHRFLKSMAPVYKTQEPEMERVFWNSRYTKR